MWNRFWGRNILTLYGIDLLEGMGDSVENHGIIFLSVGGQAWPDIVQVVFSTAVLIQPVGGAVRP